MMQLSIEYSTLLELLQKRALSAPERIAYSFLQNGEVASQITYSQLEKKAKAIASKLQSLGISGKTALLVYPYHQPLEFIAAFFGCIYAGVIAVTHNPPRSSKSIAKVLQRVESCQAEVILSSQTLIEAVAAGIPESFASRLIASDKVSIDSNQQWVQPDINGDSLAFLQYTSGSTGIPKGVMVTHTNILHNCESIKRSFENAPEKSILIWLPLFHDMGLIGGVMNPLYSGFHGLFMSPIELSQKPFLWLDAISKYQVNISGGPNFAYDLLCLKVTEAQQASLDLSNWEIAFSGAEPIRAETLERFTAKFVSCGFRREAFYPCYGMAEATLFVSGGIKQHAPLIKYLDDSALEKNQVVFVEANHRGAKPIVGCGKTWLDTEIIIVNPETLKKISPDGIGEIWVKGGGVGKGYWQQTEENQNTFAAYLEDSQEGPYLRTGDLGFLDAGELYITGRVKEVMIIWGNNQYPQHIEETVQKSHPALRLNGGAAFSMEKDGEEKLIIAQEVERKYVRNLPLEEIIGAMRMAVGGEHLIEVYGILLLKPGSLPKTSSGKIQRRACKAQYLQGTLKSIATWQQTEERDITQLFNQN